MRIRRVLAPNSGPFTGPGTNTWLLDDSGAVVVIDPGPVETSHLKAILTATEGLSAVGVVVTHGHADHAPLAGPLATELAVPTCGYGKAHGFSPDVKVSDGDHLAVGEVALEVLHTPGHSGDHLCFVAGRALFTGDHIMGGSSVMIEDLPAYLSSLRRLRSRSADLDRLYPGHGEEMDHPAGVIDWYLAHRAQREVEILGALTRGATTLGEVVEAVYLDVDRSLHPLAARSVAAHLRKLVAEGKVRLASSELEWDTPVESIE